MAKAQANPGVRTPLGVPFRRANKRKKMSSTTGKSKGLVPLPLDRVMASRSRAYKTQAIDYAEWCKKSDSKNGRGPQVEQKKK